jgi:hypothetical protein
VPRRDGEAVAENAQFKGQDAQAQLQRELAKLKEHLSLMQQRLYSTSSEKLPVSPAEERPRRTRPHRREEDSGMNSGSSPLWPIQ